jgi:hypothetical protein
MREGRGTKYNAIQSKDTEILLHFGAFNFSVTATMSLASAVRRGHAWMFDIQVCEYIENNTWIWGNMKC